VSVQVFDTKSNQQCGLVEYLDAIPDGRVLVAAVRGQVGRGLLDTNLAAFAAFGSWKVRAREGAGMTLCG
jgi:regulator of RNase E activity RraA